MSDIEDTQSIDCLMQAFSNYISAKESRDRCYRNADVSAGYYCASEDNHLADCAKEVKRWLTKVIREAAQPPLKDKL